MTMKVMPIFGTRPEAIKLAPVITALSNDHGFETVTVVTAQHRDLLDGVLHLFDIKPDVLREHQPDWVLVQGDTTTVMAAAIAAQYARIRVGHIEAGLRSYDRDNPFPEEMNRVVTGHVSSLHFAPTARARENLLRENIDPKAIIVTGNTVIDALLRARATPWTPEPGDPLFALPKDRRWLLVTAHRRENFGQPIRDICQALIRLADRGDIHIVYPVHPNPNIKDPVYELLSSHPAITLTPPLEYHPLVWLMSHCELVLTDSGGIQEEAPSLGKPVLVMRKTTERPEAVEAGTARLVGTEPDCIVTEGSQLLDDKQAYKSMSQAINPYGDGHAAERILAALRGDFGMAEWMK
jgi:UDP-N-acetylglucosamine 2-epimerase (non-hydrolysing)